jgi:hypothetical protein
LVVCPARLLRIRGPTFPQTDEAAQNGPSLHYSHRGRARGPSDECAQRHGDDGVPIARTVAVGSLAPPNTILATGGRHVEFGLALAQGKRVIIVGPRENVFHYLLPDAQIFAYWNM